MELNDLPNGPFHVLFGYFNLSTLLNAYCLVSKRWYELIHQMRIKELHFSEYPHNYPWSIAGNIFCDRSPSPVDRQYLVRWKDGSKEKNRLSDHLYIAGGGISSVDHLATFPNLKELHYKCRLYWPSNGSTTRVDRGKKRYFLKATVPDSFLLKKDEITMEEMTFHLNHMKISESSS